MCGIFLSFGEESMEDVMPWFQKIKHRGPDATCLLEVEKIKVGAKTHNMIMGFHRLSIIDTSIQSMQPFILDDLIMVCNGEIYNYKELKAEFGITTKTDSDCEVILHLYNMLGRNSTALERFLPMLNAEFAFVIYDMKRKEIVAARDIFGVRPLFISAGNGTVALASELKALRFNIMADPGAFKPASYAVIPICDDNGHSIGISSITLRTTSYFSLNPRQPRICDRDLIVESVRNIVQNAVRTRLIGQRPIGCFLSGGVDSSIITAIVARHVRHLHCFSIGMPGSSDIVAAQKVVQFLNDNGAQIQHHIVDFDIEHALSQIDAVIFQIETFDITTIRASVPQYILSKYISEKTDVRVLFSGEGADEMFNSYLYSRLAPSAEALEEDSYRLLRELYMFDNLRVDRTTAAAGLEVRIPFLDKELARFMTAINPDFRRCDDKIEKKILRDAFAGFLPDEILYRQKHAFSDAVSSSDVSWYKSIQKKISSVIDERDFVFYNDFEPAIDTVEGFYYRWVFEKMYYGCNILTHYWMPKWVKTNGDPSATVLPCYSRPAPA